MPDPIRVKTPREGGTGAAETGDYVRTWKA
jgi:hypothetical protein